jgi:membrane-associated phospholipid phosphatase
MRQAILENKLFYVPYLFVLMVCGFFLVQFTKAETHIWLNSYNSSFFDIFFKYLTNLGDGISLPVLLLIAVWARFRDGVYLVVVFLLSGFFVQVLKRFVFPDMDRPTKFLGENVHLHLVDGVKQHCCHSFPSGHAATAFGFFLCFAMISKRNWIKGSMFVLACLVAYSRVYLSQHFLIDIFVGSLIGTIVATTCYSWIYTLNGAWMDTNLKTIIAKKPK